MDFKFRDIIEGTIHYLWQGGEAGKKLKVIHQFSLSLNIGYMLEEQISHPHCSLDFALAALIFGPKQDEAMVSVYFKHHPRHTFYANTFKKIQSQFYHFFGKMIVK